MINRFPDDGMKIFIRWGKRVLFLFFFFFFFFLFFTRAGRGGVAHGRALSHRVQRIADGIFGFILLAPRSLKGRGGWTKDCKVEAWVWMSERRNISRTDECVPWGRVAWSARAGLRMTGFSFFPRSYVSPTPLYNFSRKMTKKVYDDEKCMTRQLRRSMAIGIF